ncbi:MFS transporter [Amycolatopsis kentuckyensis]|uniref:MFS transporter n=1 Tax=Amycolatopsis kentuckyensis TaxID=218823 RepID=UPI0035686711
MGVLGNRDFRRLWLADLVSQLGSRVDVLAVPLLAVTTLPTQLRRVATWDHGGPRPSLGGRPRSQFIAPGRQNRASGLRTAQLSTSRQGCGQLGASVFEVALLLKGRTGRTWCSACRSARGCPDAPSPGADRRRHRPPLLLAPIPVAGLVVQALGIAAALAVDAVSYLWSALWLRRIETPDLRPEPRPRRLLREIGDGLRVVRGDRILLAVSVHGAVSSFFQSVHLAIVVVFLARDVGLSAWAIGLLGTVTLAGALTAGLTARRIGARIGGARALWGAAVLYGLAYQLYPFTGPGWGLTCYVVAGFFACFGVIVLNVFGMSYQQAAAPPELLGRVNSITHTLVFGAVPLGSLLGGALASAFGMRVTLHIAAAGVLASAAILLWSPLRQLRDLNGVSAGHP